MVKNCRCLVGQRPKYARTKAIAFAQQEYVYSSASNYVRNEGIINVCIPSVPIIDFTKQNSIIEINEW